jgi:hypothetical protein
MADSTSDASAAPATDHDATLDDLIAASEKRLGQLRRRRERLDRELNAEETLNADLHARRGTTPTPPGAEPIATPPATPHPPAQVRSDEPARGPRHRRHDDAGLSILEEPDEGEESSPRHLTVNPHLEHRASHDDDSESLEEEDAAQEHPEHQGPPLHHEEDDREDTRKKGPHAALRRLRLRVRAFLDTTIRNETV